VPFISREDLEITIAAYVARVFRLSRLEV